MAALPLFTTARAQTSELAQVSYAPTDEHFANPERGFFDYVETYPTSPVLRAENLRSGRLQAQSLIWLLYTISSFRDKDLPQSLLDKMDGDFAALREAGVKCVLRIRYSRSMTEPDAPLEVVLRHLDQLQPVFERNYDVIAVAQAGFIGAWGEWHSSTNNLTRLENMRAILFKFMDVLPQRAIQIRYPEAKMQIFETSTALTAEEAFNGTDKARAGHHNDCFLASHDDVGTYRISPTWEKNYLNKETRYLPMGGETCAVEEGEYYLCANALKELAQMHWSYLNSDYYAGILNHWRQEGCMPEIERRLGYRFAMHEGRYSPAVAPGATFRFELNVANEGFAAPYNPRGLQAVLRSQTDPQRAYEVNLPSDPRFWTAGETQMLAFDLGIPGDMPEGDYSLHLFLPDPMEALHNRPEYAIRMANEGVWENETGMNDLHHVVQVDASVGGAAYTGGNWFVKEGTSTLSSERPSRASVGVRLFQSTPNPFRNAATIQYELEEPAHVTLDVYDALGRHVQRLLSASQSAGIHEARFAAEGLAGGRYFYQIATSDGSTATLSMTLLP